MAGACNLATRKLEMVDDMRVAMLVHVMYVMRWLKLCVKAVNTRLNDERGSDMQRTVGVF